MRDFVFPNPFYVSAGINKELGDLILVLDSESIVASIKATDGSPKSPEKMKRWLSKQAREGARPAKTASQRLDIVTTHGTNLWGEQKVFSPGTLNPKCGIVLLEHRREDADSKESFENLTLRMDLPQSN